ncbi:MAG: VRR-NUC domain-containing protein [Candidatus Dormibacteraceae bacterium]
MTLATKAPAISEADFQRRVVAMATLRGFRVAHFRPAQSRRGQWSTPMTGHPGFPDLVLAKAGRVLFLELKTQSGRLRPEQIAWMDALSGDVALSSRVEAWVVRPSDWDAIVRLLER